MKWTPELRDRLASEYVLGTLRGPARRHFEGRLRTDRELKSCVTAWESHLTPLAERVAPIEPPKRVWANIEQRIGTATATSAKAEVAQGPLGDIGKLAGQLAFWRRFSFAAGGLASFLLVTMFVFYGLRPGGTANTDPMPMMTAVLEEEGEARMMVKQMRPGYMTVHMIKPWQPAPNMSKELWVVTKDGKAKSLGLLENDGDTRISMADLDRYLEQGAIIALSKEPLGGSKTGQPSMVFCKGVIARMPPKPAKAQQPI
jgi:anti-sigma-K factor RskA